MNPIYLDYQATTPTDPRVVDAMRPYWTQDFGNSHSEGHPFGWKSKRAVEIARAQVANFINADDDEIVFVSGATESCNLALRGTALSEKGKERRKIITLATEHPAVLETANFLSNIGYDTKILPVLPDGILDLDVLASELDEETLLVSVMLANNEIGVIQPLEKISAMCHDAGAFVHSDATQAAGRIAIDVENLGIDLLSISGHKIYGPNGIGVLYIRSRPDLKIEPMMTGGHQERGLRPGTIPVPLVVGMGEACRIASHDLPKEAERLLRSQSTFADRTGGRVSVTPLIRIPGKTHPRKPECRPPWCTRGTGSRSSVGPSGNINGSRMLNRLTGSITRPDSTRPRPGTCNFRH